MQYSKEIRCNWYVNIHWNCCFCIVVHNASFFQLLQLRQVQVISYLKSPVLWMYASNRLCHSDLDFVQGSLQAKYLLVEWFHCGKGPGIDWAVNQIKLIPRPIEMWPFAPAYLTCQWLTHWGRVTHICVNKLTVIGSDNGLSPGRSQAIIWTNAGILLIWTLGINFSEILIEIRPFPFKKMHLKMSSGKWRPFCLGLNVF